MKQAEIGIAGGGLAGLALGIMLARKGQQVVLWEKGNYPAHRVCGEYISNESLPFLKSLLPDFEWNQLPQIHRLLLSSPSGRMIREDLELGGFGVSRYKLDAALADEAKRSGVLLQESCTVRDFSSHDGSFFVETSVGNWNCKDLFLAFGKGRGPGEPPRKPKAGRHFVGVKYHIRYPHPPDEIQLHNFRNGYCGMSRIEDGISCLCYLVDAAELQACGGVIRQMEKIVVQKNPELNKIFLQAEFLWDSPKVISGIRFGEWGSTRNNAILLGDAAGCIAPLCGNGMSLALHAASELSSLKENNAALKGHYAQFRQSAFKTRINAGSLIQAFFGGEFLTNSAVGFLSVLPSSLRRKIIRKTHGQPF